MRRVVTSVPLLIAALGWADMDRAALADSGQTLTLAGAVDLALDQNPSMHRARAGVELASAQLAGALGSRLPLVQAKQTFVHGNNPVFVFGSLLEQERFGAANFDPGFLNDPEALTNWRTELGIRLPVLDQRQASTRIAQARSVRTQAADQQRMTEQQIRLAVIRSYYEVLVAEAQSQVAQEAVLTAQTEAERTRQMTETGLRVESDLLAAEVQLAQLEQQRIQTEGQVAVSRAALSVVLGLEVGAALRLEGELPESQFSLPEEAELLRLAFENRPDYAALREAASDAGRGVWGAKGQYLPQLDAFGSYGWSGEDPASGSSDYTLGAALTLHLFEPGRRARVEQARAQESLVQAEADALAQSIRLEVVRACRQFVSARSRLTVSARAVGQASEALRIVQDRYGEGLVTITEVLRAQTALLEARKNALQARFDHQVGYAMVLLASGRLTGIESFLEPTGGKQS